MKHREIVKCDGRTPPFDFHEFLHCVYWSTETFHHYSVCSNLVKNYCTCLVCSNVIDRWFPSSIFQVRNIEYDHSHFAFVIERIRNKWGNNKKLFFFLKAKPAKECLDIENGENYFGTVRHTKTGVQCLRWDSQAAHIYDYNFLDEQEDYCRNPYGGASSPFCFTADSDGWGTCDIPFCS